MSTISIAMGNLVKIRPVIQKLVNQELPIKAAFRLSRTAKSLEELFKLYEEQRTRLVKLHGITSADGKNVSVPPENMPKFQTELVVLLEEVVKTEIEAIPLALLGEDIKLTAMEILVLEEAGIVKES